MSRYHARSASASADLTKIPPMPITLAIARLSHGPRLRTAGPLPQAHRGVHDEARGGAVLDREPARQAADHLDVGVAAQRHVVGGEVGRDVRPGVVADLARAGERLEPRGVAA